MIFVIMGAALHKNAKNNVIFKMECQKWQVLILQCSFLLIKPDWAD